MRRIKLQTAPTIEPVTLAEAKAHLRISTSSDDTYVSTLITTARIACEKRSHVAFITQTYDLFMDCWGEGSGGYSLSYPSEGSTLYTGSGKRAREIVLPHGPVQSVTYIKYYDQTGTLQTWDASNYVVSTGDPCRVSLASSSSYPAHADRIEAIQVRYVAGFGSLAADVPSTVKHAIYLLMGHWFEHREAVVTGTITAVLPEAVDALLSTVSSGKEIFA
jgi:hypothetical protein